MGDGSACPPDEVSLKCFFLGPQAENSQFALSSVTKILEHYFDWRKSLFPQDGRAISEADIQSESFQRKRQACNDRLIELMTLLEGETPKFTPRYIGHMVSETSLPAILGHIVMLVHNPNMASLEAAKVASKIEGDALADLHRMIGFEVDSAKGHFTSGGTVANFEGILRARYRFDHWLSLGSCLRDLGHTKESLFSLAHMGWAKFDALVKQWSISDEVLRSYSLVAGNPWEAGRRVSDLFECRFRGPVILVPGHKHYSWLKGVSVFGLGEEAFWPVELDEQGKQSVTSLRQQLERARGEGRPVMMVVSVAGTTEFGEFDPVDKIQDVLDEYERQEGIHIWHHVDAAYGGFFCAMLSSANVATTLASSTIQALLGLRRATSVTLDPHKLGYVPYSCGAFLARDARANEVSSFAAAYLTTQANAKGNWSSTLEGSRSATGAAALWLSARCIGLDGNGYGKILEKGVVARKKLEELLMSTVKDCHLVPDLDTNIVSFCVALLGEPLSRTNERSLKIYDAIANGPDFSISKTTIGSKEYREMMLAMTRKWGGQADCGHLVLIRLVLMNPFIQTRESSTLFLEEFAGMVRDISSGLT